MRPSSVKGKLLEKSCRKSYYVKYNVCSMSDIFCNFNARNFYEYPPNKPVMGVTGVLCKVTNYLRLCQTIS